MLGIADSKIKHKKRGFDTLSYTHTAGFSFRTSLHILLHVA